MTIVVGSHFYSGDAAATERQEQAIDALAGLTGVRAVNLQWNPAPDRGPWLQTLPVLRRDSTSITGAPGRVKPVACDVFNALADVAERGGHRYFLFFNADLRISQAAVDRIAREAKDAYAFSRLDIGGEKPPAVMTYGIDAFAFDVSWWRLHGWRFRPYILGEMCWDNVYAAILMAHGNGLIENRHGEMAHPRHATAWGEGPLGQYNGYLAALDSRYFSLWVRYHERLLAARAEGAPEDAERALAAETFAWRRSSVAAARQAATSVRAYVRHRTQRRQWSAQA
jgi:hypothetical protein